MKGIANIIVREFKFVFSSRVFIFALLVFPILDCLFLAGIYNSAFLTKLPVAVIDKDNTKISRTLTRYFNASPDMEVKYRISNTDELKDLFASQKAVLGLYIPKGTQKNIKKTKTQKIPVFINSANYIEGNMADIDANTIISVVSGGIKYKTLLKRGFSSKQAKSLLQPIENDTAKLFNPSLNYNTFLTPGLWMTLIQQLLVLAGLVTIACEFDLRRIRSTLKSANGKLINAFTGKILFFIVFAYIHFEIVYRILFPVFHIPMTSSVCASMFLSLCFSFASISLGMLLSSLISTTSNSLKACIVLSVPAFLFSGYTWPLEMMPGFLRQIVEIIPLTPFMAGFRKIYMQGLGFEFAAPYMKQLLLSGIIYFTGAYIAIYIRIKGEKYGSELKSF